MKAVLHQEAPGVPVIDLFANAPAHDPRASAYLLAAFSAGFPKNTVFFAVVDPGVGGARKPGVLKADGRWYVGPDNGLFEIIIERRLKEEPKTLEQLGQKFGISRERVRQLEVRAFEKVQKAVTAAVAQEGAEA